MENNTNTNSKKKNGFLTFLKGRKTPLILLLIIAVAVGYGGASALKPTEVTVKTVAKGTFLKTVEEVAYVSDADQYELYSQIGGEVKTVRFKSGDPVREGEVVMELVNPQQESQMSQLQVQVSQIQTQITQASGQMKAQSVVVSAAKTALDQAKKDLARAEQLYGMGGIAMTALDQAKQLYTQAQESYRSAVAQYDAAKSTISSLQQQKTAAGGMIEAQKNMSSELVVKSPKNGVLLSMPWEPGQVVGAGQLLMAVGTGNKLIVKAEFLADDTIAMKTGQKTIITSSVLPEAGIEGTVTHIDPTAEEKVSALGIAQRRIEVTIDVPQNDSLKPGFEVRAAVVTEEIDDAIVVSQAWLHKSGDQIMIWVVRDNKLNEQAIEIISQNSKEAAVSGVDAGDVIATDVPANAKEGMKVKSAAE